MNSNQIYCIRRGLSDLSKALGCHVCRFEILKYPDRAKYRLFIDNSESSITLTASELCSPGAFRPKFMKLTNKILRPIKKNEWYRLIEQALSEAIEIDMEKKTLDINLKARYSSNHDFRPKISH